MKNKRKLLFQWAVLIAFFFAIGFTYEYHLPQIESWLLVKIEDIAAKRTPLQIIPSKLRLTLFPLGVVIKDIRVLPKKGLDRVLAPARLDEVALGVNFWSLIRGEVRLSRVILRNSNVTMFLHSEMFEKKTPGEKKTFKLEDLREIPVDEIQLENMTIMGRMDPQGLVFKVSALDVDIVNLYNSLYVYVGSPSWQLKPAGPYPTLDMEAQFRGLLDAQELRISALKMKSKESFLVASGMLNGDFSNGKIENGKLSLRTHWELEDIATWVRVLPKPPTLPKMSGVVSLNADILHKGVNQQPDLHVNLESKDLQVDVFKIGDVSTKGSVTAESFKSERVHVHNEAGDISFKNVNVAWKPEIKFEAVTELEKVELRQLLQNLDVKNVPIHLDITASTPCKGGYLASKLEIRCEGELRGSNLSVWSGKTKKTIVKSKKFMGRGWVTIDDTKVKYQSDVWMGDKSKGRSSGAIDYEKGFQIQYEGDNLDFADVENLVDLKIEGSAKVKGSTEGNSDRATVMMDVKTKDLWFEDFGVGEMASQISYKTGHLYLKEIEGQYGVSRYAGNIDIDVVNEQIIAVAKMPFVDLRDLKSLLTRRLPIPVAITGTGAGNAKVWGPLNIEKLNYQVNSEFFRGTIAGETFDALRFDFEAENGIARTKRVQALKANGQFEMRGLLKPAWTIDTVLVGRGLRLEQSELINSIGFDLQGQTDFNFVIRGPLKKPQMELNGRLSKVIIADQPQDDSSFRLDFTNTRMSGSGQFLGNKVQTQFVIPLEDRAPFLFEAKTNNWDFTSVFSLLSKSARQLDFQTGLTMEAKLRADQGGFWNSSGVVEVKDMRIRHGAEMMKAEAPMKLIFNKGVVTSDNFSISSGDNFLKLNVANLTRDKFNADLNGKMDLSLFGLIAPFISDLRGLVALSIDLRGSYEKPTLSGSTFVDKGYVKLRDFPHPFSNVRADLLFNQQTLMINAFRSELGGGKLTGDGRISFLGRGNVPVDIRGTFTDVSVNIPEGFKTRGSGKATIKGQKFPYTMGLQYEVTNGDVTAEFASQAQTSAVKASPYLPKFVQQESFEAFRFEIDLSLKKYATVSNSLMNAQVQGSVQIKGTPDQFLLTGTFSPLPGGKVFFRDRPFEITTGYVEYANYPPDNPKIYLTATAHVTETVTDQQQTFQANTAGATPRQVENRYDVSLLVQGRAQPTPQITLSSQPPLSQREIVSLLALGMTPTALDEQRGSQSANVTIGTAILQQPVGKKLKESFGVDVKVSTAPPTGTDTAAAPMVTFSKQWTPKFSASASSTVGQTQTNGVKLEYKMNNSVSAIGSWEDRGQSSTAFSDKKDVSPSIFGLDLEYKVNFK